MSCNFGRTTCSLLLVIVCFVGIGLSDGQNETDTKQVAKTETSLSWYDWRLSDVWKWLIGGDEIDGSDSRTFGLKRRIQSALIPIMFKFGVLSMMITILVFLALKTFFLVKTLLVLNLGGLLAKLLIWKSGAEHGNSGGWGHSGGWAIAPAHKEVHIHIHNNGENGHNKWKSNDPYGAYSSTNYQYVPIPMQQRLDYTQNYNTPPVPFEQSHNFVYHGKEKYV